MNVGILGGTFDPIHLGHLIIAQEARLKLRLNEILFIPAGQPWLKVNKPITPANHRVEMVRLAITDNPHFKLSNVEIERAGFSYSVDTVSILRQQLGNGTKLFFILGYDSLAELPSWKEPHRLIEMCQLVAIPRLGCVQPNLESLEATIPGITKSTILLDTPLIDIRSSEIRRHVIEGLSIRYLVPDNVERYIMEEGLYCN